MTARIPLALALAACMPETPPSGTPWDDDLLPTVITDDVPPNVIVVLVDDFGVDALALYGDATGATTPTLDALAANGVLFRNAWASPVCSNTRAGLVTGRLPVQHGFGDANGMPPPPGFALRHDEITLPEALDAGTAGLYDHAMVGKWHLHDQTIPEHPEGITAHGFRHYRGHPDNLGKRILDDGQWENQRHYWKWVGDAAWLQVGTYVTTDEIDDALSFTESLDEPWFLYLAPHATHDPWAPPPPALNPDGVDWDDDPPTRYRATVVALDLELGRLLDEMDPAVLARTTIIVMGDNGTPGNALAGASVGRPAKGSVHDGGVHVPLIVAGAGVGDPGREVDDLVTHFDVFATVLDLAHADHEPPPSSVSFAGVLGAPDTTRARAVAYEDRFEPSFAALGVRTNWIRTARTPRYKLLRYPGQPDRLVDLDADPLEETNLLDGALDPEADDAYGALLAEFAAVEAVDRAEWDDAL